MFFSSFVSIGMGKMLIVSTVIGTWKVSCKLVLCNPTLQVNESQYRQHVYCDLKVSCELFLQS